MTDPGRRSNPGGPDFAASRLLLMLGPVLALGAFTALLAAGAGIFGWYQAEMLLIVSGVSGFLLFATVTLLYRQISERQASRQRLQNVEARVDNIVESAMDPIIAVGEDQRIVLFNKAAEEVFGHARSAMLGAPLDRLMPARFHDSHHEHVERFGRTGSTSRRMGEQMVLWGMRASGEEFPIEASISQHVEGGRMLFTVILRDISGRVRADEALRQSREELRALAAAAQTVREQEKSRIARELHDELAQALTALKIDVAWVREKLPAADKAVAGKLAAMQAMLDGTVAATRRISADLRPLMLDDLGLVPAAEWLAQDFSQRTGIACELAVGRAEIELHDPHATAVFRILQESLTNIAKHAGATQVEVTIEQNAKDITLTVADNGRGFAVADPRKPGSFGLLGLRERAYLLGGELKIDSTPGAGTRIEVVLPLRQEAHAA